MENAEVKSRDQVKAEREAKKAAKALAKASKGKKKDGNESASNVNNIPQQKQAKEIKKEVGNIVEKLSQVKISKSSEQNVGEAKKKPDNSPKVVESEKKPTENVAGKTIE